MAYPPKIREALEVLAATGMGRSTYAPLIYRLFWSIGIPIRPPHFANFFSNVLVMGGGYGVIFTGTMWLISDHERTIASLVGQCLFTALAFGLIMAAWTQSRNRKHNLPDWSEIGVAKRFD